MFRLVLGRSKSGKTEYVRNYLSALASQGEKKLLMIVPDQQTFDTEKAFLELLGPMDAMNVKVLGFSRLCDYVFEETGYVSGVLADESVRSLVMSMALEDTSDNLKIYAERATSPDLLSMMLSVHKEFVRGKISPEILRSADIKDNTILRSKLHDTSLVLSAYDSLLSTSFEDAEGALSIAADLLAKHRIFDDYYICVDSYLSFTELELDILSLLMTQCKELLVTLSDDKNLTEDSIFAISKATAARLTTISKDNCVTVSPAIVCDYNGYFDNETLTHIEANIFDYTSHPVKLTLPESAPVMVYNAHNIYEEADFVARKIRELVMTQGYRYNDIAVVCRDVTPYYNVLDTALSRYDVSYFMDTAGAIHSKPLIKLISACFDTITTSFDKDNVLAVLKTGLLFTKVTDLAAFENYLFTWGITGKKFYNEFTANPRGFVDDFTESDKETLKKVEDIRKSTIVPLLEFRENVKDATAETICKELYYLLLRLGVDYTIRVMCSEYEDDSESEIAEDFTRLWQIFTDTLDRTVSVIGNRRITPKRFSQLLSLQFAAQDISYIPRAADQVTVGDIERLRLSDKKVVFVIGANEGKFPKASADSGLFTSVERTTLFDAGILKMNAADTDYLREQYLCYYALTSASEKLYVSYLSSDLKGSTLTPSELVSALTSLFENLDAVNSADVPIIDRLWAPGPAFDIYASKYCDGDSISIDLASYFIPDEDYAPAIEALKRALEHEKLDIRDKKIAKEFFGDNMYLSASKVEKYHMCRFAYFCEYGLRLSERRTATIDPMERGTFVHHILEHFVASYTKLQLANLTDEEIRTVVNELSSAYAQKHFGGFEDKSSRFRYLFDRVTVNVCKLIRHLITELTQSSFTPKAQELNIGKDIPAYSLTLPSGQKITITGMVDRADVMEKDGKSYIRIIDYKTGKKLFSLSDVMYGINLQMLIYLSAIVNNGKEFFGENIVPAGALYMPATTPVVSADVADFDAIMKARCKQLRMNGLILRDMDVLEGMDKDIGGLYIPVSTTKKGTLKGDSNLATLEEIGAVFSKIDSIIGKMATELTSGNIDPLPAKVTYDACKYCSYKGICKHKDTDPERDIYKLDHSEIVQMLGLTEEEVDL